MPPIYSLGSTTAALGVPPVNSQSRSLYSASTPRSSMASTNANIHGNGSNAFQKPHAYAQNADFMLSSSNSDLERLERLKREILEGQNPYYQPIPRPDYLESLYLGRQSVTTAAEAQASTVQSKNHDVPRVAVIPNAEFRHESLNGTPVSQIKTDVHDFGKSCSQVTNSSKEANGTHIPGISQKLSAGQPVVSANLKTSTEPAELKEREVLKDHMEEKSQFEKRVEQSEQQKSRSTTQSAEQAAGDSRLLRASLIEKPHEIKEKDITDHSTKEGVHDLTKTVEEKRIKDTSEYESNSVTKSSAHNNGQTLQIFEKAAVFNRMTDVPQPLEARISLVSPIKEEKDNDHLQLTLEERIGSRANNQEEMTSTVSSEVGSSKTAPSLQERISSRPSLEERIGDKLSQSLDNKSRAAVNFAPRGTDQEQADFDDKAQSESRSMTRADDRPGQIARARGVYDQPSFDADSLPASSTNTHRNARAQFGSSRNISPRTADNSYRAWTETRRGTNVPRLDSDRHYSGDRRADADFRGIPPSLDDHILPARTPDYFVPNTHDRYIPPGPDPKARVYNGDERSYRNSWDRAESPARSSHLDRASSREAWDVYPPDEHRQPGPPPMSWDRFDPAARHPEDFPPDDYHTREFERSRYPPDEYPHPNSRIRRRSPSPYRHISEHLEDTRPYKRTRESAYYAPPPRDDLPRDIYFDRRRPSYYDSDVYYEPRELSYAPHDLPRPFRERSPPFHERVPL